MPPTCPKTPPPHLHTELLPLGLGVLPWRTHPLPQLVLIVLYDQLFPDSSEVSPFSLQLPGLQMSWARVGAFSLPVLEVSG